MGNPGNLDARRSLVAVSLGALLSLGRMCSRLEKSGQNSYMFRKAHQTGQNSYSEPKIRHKIQQVPKSERFN